MCLAAVCGALLLPIGAVVLAQRVADTTVLRSTGAVHVERPTIVVFHDGSKSSTYAAAHTQALRLRAPLDSLGITVLERSGTTFPYFVAGAIVLWSAPPDSLPYGYVFLKRERIPYVRYGWVADSVLRRAIDVWHPPSVRIRER